MRPYPTFGTCERPMVGLNHSLLLETASACACLLVCSVVHAWDGVSVFFCIATDTSVFVIGIGVLRNPEKTKNETFCTCLESSAASLPAAACLLRGA